MKSWISNDFMIYTKIEIEYSENENKKMQMCMSTKVKIRIAWKQCMFGLKKELFDFRIENMREEFFSTMIFYAMHQITNRGKILIPYQKGTSEKRKCYL